MKLQGFRIKNFRSIKDTSWQNFSPDNITGLIGQNEAGKTTILEALYSFHTAKISKDVLRSDRTMPEVLCSFQISWDEIKELFKEKILPKGLAKIINEKKRINLKRTWGNVNEGGELTLEEDDILGLFKQSESEYSEEQLDEQKPENEVAVQQGEELVEIAKEQFIETIFDGTPEFELFEDLASLLPDTIDIEDLQNKNTKAEGYKGAQNLLAISGLDLNFLQNDELRIVENQIERLNKSVTANFQEFWRQKVGKTNKIAIEFELEHHDEKQTEIAGKPYLVFWIKDGGEKLYPKQRSKGVRWFTSFYLQLKASSLDIKHSRIFLIDEPGGSLHARAQEDVLKVFEEIKDKVQVIYTTHSPYLIKLETIYRLLAVQRADEEDDKSGTLVFSTHKLGSASSDTLSPIYTLMGADFSHQRVIRKNNNILLEEISAFYYIHSFWKLTGSQKEAHFLPVTGANNIPQLANLFLGWGLDFGVVVDDDSAGRTIYNGLKRDLFLDNEIRANERMLKIKGCLGIEDLFTSADLKKHILEDATLSFRQKNSEYMRGKPKAIFALKFMLKVNEGKLKIGNLEKSTQDNIKSLVSNIEAILK